MNMSNLFKSKKQKAMEVKKHVRRSKRGVEDLKRQVAKLQTDAKSSWEAARAKLAEGLKKAARQELANYRWLQSMALKVDQQRFVVQRYTTLLEMAQKNTEIANILGKLEKATSIPIDKVENVFTAIGLKGDELAEMQHLYEDEASRQMEDVGEGTEEGLPALDDLVEELQDEVAEGIRSGGVGERDSGIAADIEKGNAEVNKILDDKDGSK